MVSRVNFPLAELSGLLQTSAEQSAQWHEQMSTLTAQFESAPQQTWLLYEPDFERFSQLFLALLGAGKSLVLTANGQPQRLRELSGQFDIAILPEPLTDIPCWQGPSFTQASVRAGLCVGMHSSIAFFTSGSSGEPKQINKTFGQLWLEVEAQAGLWPVTSFSKVAASVSHLHIYGLLFKLLLPLRCRLPVHAPLIQFPEQLEQLLEEQPALLFVSSPAYLNRVVLSEQWCINGAQPALTISSGGPLGPEVASYAYANQQCPPIEVYGSTETGGIAWRQFPQTDWQPLPGVEIATDEDSRLMLKSPWVDPLQWTATDDKVRVTSHQYFALLGRLDRIVKLEEKRLSLDELEKTLLCHPLCQQVKTLLLPGARAQLAAVVQVAGVHDRLALIATFKAYLAGYYEAVLIPRKWRFVSIMPMNNQGKITQQALMELFE